MFNDTQKLALVLHTFIVVIVVAGACTLGVLGDLDKTTIGAIFGVAIANPTMRAMPDRWRSRNDNGG